MTFFSLTGRHAKHDHLSILVGHLDESCFSPGGDVEHFTFPVGEPLDLARFTIVVLIVRIEEQRVEVISLRVSKFAATPDPQSLPVVEPAGKMPLTSDLSHVDSLWQIHGNEFRF